MTFLCRMCNEEITGRDSRAKKCWSCYGLYGRDSGARKAISLVNQAVKKGILPIVKTLNCVDCGRPGECYDLRDYSKPLAVVPVCRKCNFRRGSAIPLKKDVASEINDKLK